MWIRDGEPIPGSFRNINGGMSTDWEKYSTAQQSRNRATSDPSRNGVISLIVKDVRDIPYQTVEHDPSIDNRAHTNVLGEKGTEERLRFMRIYRWEIRI